MLETLRQRRFLGLFGATIFVALICFAAGTWQIARFHQKHDANNELRSNNKHAVTDVSTALGPAANRTAVGAADELRHVSATGTYLDADETMVRGQSVNGTVGYLVVTPFKTGSGVLLVVRGFVSQTERAADTPKVSPAPTGVQSLTARLQPASSRPDRFGVLPANQVESINPVDQAARLGEPVWNGYAELLAGQPGTAGLTTIPDPDLSNPAGGAEEPQHAAYVVQWYAFGGLALALPFVLAAAERRRAEEDAPRQPVTAPGDAKPAAERSSRKARRAALDERLAGRS